MQKASDFNALEMGDMKNLAEEVPPVKVSIPFSRLTRTEREYVPHRRNSYDPHEQTDIGAVKFFIFLFLELLLKLHPQFLYKGNVPHTARKQKKTVRPLASLKDVSRLFKKHSEKKERVKAI